MVFLPPAAHLDMNRIGPAFEYHPLFPERVNTEFIQVIDRNTLKMRGGSGAAGRPGPAGTGACAAAGPRCLNGYCNKNENITVKLTGGDLIIRYTDEAVYMTGNCTIVFEGAVEFDRTE